MKLVKTLALCGLGLFGASYAIAVTSHHWYAPKQEAEVNIQDPALIKQGEYLARAGDCIACHTAPGGKEFAGGLGMQTPLGTIYSTNITPDKKTGIGNYSYGDFERAVRRGVRPDGVALYPAMPYVSYVVVKDDDIKALYAYFMSRVESVEQDNQASTLPWPMNMRWPLAYWQLAFAQPREFTSATGMDAMVDRGAYLVEGLAHCGACHTPRGIGYQEVALSDDKKGNYLSGSVLEGWYAKNLRDEGTGLSTWTEAEITDFLKTGRNDRTAAFGAMSDVVAHSTQYLTDDDLTSIARYLKSLPARASHPQQWTPKEDDTTAALRAGDFSAPGAVGYVDNCAACHRLDGRGAERTFPALAGNSIVFAEDASSLIQLTLDGAAMADTPHDPMVFKMPGFAHLTNKEIADILNFIRNGWGNHGSHIKDSDIARMRHLIEHKPVHYVPEAKTMSKQFWIGTAAALVVTIAAAGAGWTFIVKPSRVDAPPLPTYDVVDADGKVVGKYTIPSDDLIAKEPDAEAIMYGKRLLNETARLMPENVGAGLNCNSCHLAQGKLDKGAPYINSYNYYPRVMPRAGKEVNLVMRINGCFQRSMNGKPVDPKSKEMNAMIAYMKWLGQGVPKEHMVKVAGAGKIDETLVPDPVKGKGIYDTQCAVCHGKDGEGKKDQFGDYIFPPLWGDDSFNIGAGMARTYKAAAFVKYNMPVSVHLGGPLGQGDTLTDQEAVDVSEYFTHMPRPDFAGKVNDWPNGKKPKDARY